MNPFASFGHRLYSLRINRGWTQQELANRVNRTIYKPDVKQPHIAGLERSTGEKLPSVPLLAALAEVFEVEMQVLLGIDVEQDDESQNADLLKGLRPEDRALVLSLISRIRNDDESVNCSRREISPVLW